MTDSASDTAVMTERKSRCDRRGEGAVPYTALVSLGYVAVGVRTVLHLIAPFFTNIVKCIIML